MISLPITHPDILEFVNLKRDLDRATKANISVMITDDFMVAVEGNDDWELKFEVPDTGEVISKVVKARDIMKEIASASWDMAEPGVLFWDRVEGWHINSENDQLEYASVNPCGEKPLPAGGSCLLSSSNLSEYVLNPFTDNAIFDYNTFDKDVREIVVYMNDLLDEGLEYLPLQEQIDSAKKYRQLGIGIMGMADMLIKLGIRYGSEESIEILDMIMSTMANSALQQSALLAKEHGVYPAYDAESVYNSIYLHYVSSPKTLELIEKYGLRNAELLSIAPTGTISTMLGVSGGCEPIFQNSYTRKSESLTDADGNPSYYKVYTPIVQEYMKEFNIKDESELPEEFVTSMSLKYEERILVQGVLQDYVDSAISSTVNLPEETTVEEVMDLYIKAWKAGLKGITVYRDGCQRGGILISNKKESKSNEINKLQEQMDNLIVESLLENPNVCPMCEGELVHTGGCNECVDCGYSPCSI